MFSYIQRATRPIFVVTAERHRKMFQPPLNNLNNPIPSRKLLYSYGKYRHVE